MTAILAVWAYDEIVVSADSRTTKEPEGEQALPEYFDQEEKIIPFISKDTFVVVRGVVKEDEFGFDFHDILTGNVDEHCSFDENLFRITSATQKEFNKLMVWLKDKHGADYISSKNLSISFVAFGVENKELRFSTRAIDDFGINGRDITKRSQVDIPHLWACGSKVGQKFFKEAYPNPKNEFDYIKMCTDFVRLHIEHDSSCGGEIKTVKVSSEGSEWH